MIGESSDNRAHFERLFQVSLDCLCLAGLDGYFKMVNPAFSRTLGWTEEQLLNKPYLDFVHEEDRPSTLAEMDRLRTESRPTLNFQNRYLCSNGEYLTFMWKAYPDTETGLIYAIARDITEYERLNERFRLAVNAAPAAMIMTDKDGRIEMLNHEGERLLGYQEEEVVGEPVEILVPEPLRMVHREQRGQYMVQPETRLMGAVRELEARRKDGSTFPTEITLNLVQSSGELHVLSVLVDVSEKREVERLKRQFTAAVSHELRTPMTAVHGALSLIRGGVTGAIPKKTEELVRIAEDNCARLMRLLNDILDVEKLHEGKMQIQREPMDLVSLVQRVKRENEPLSMQHEISIELDIQVEEALVQADPDRMNQVLTNLVSNALKFSPPGESVKIRLLDVRDAFRVEVVDRGTGIPDNFRDQVFETFTQARATEGAYGGSSGLGLAITKNLVELHGGDIGFTGGDGGGTVFHFEIPRA